jgi:predicted dienelactone hydrolase
MTPAEGFSIASCDSESRKIIATFPKPRGFTRMIRLLVAFLLLSPAFAGGPKDPYDPLRVSGAEIASLTFEAKDSSRDRTLPLRVYLPYSAKPAPVILFSHGLGGSRDNNPYLGNHWAKRGYLVVFVQHPGSDESVWKSQPALQRMAAMKNAASLDNMIARGKDIPFVIDTLTTWNRNMKHPLHQRMNIDAIGMSGHSFGAITTQSVAGQVYPGSRLSFTEPRIDAAVMMSPGPPAIGDPAKAFGSIRIPCLLMTGTEDDSPIGKQTPEDRLKVFPHLQKAPAWQVVFDGADHMDFGQRSLRGDEIKNTRYHKAILELTTAFWDATLQQNTPATSWLKGKGASSVLAPKDVWQSNGK